LNRRRLLREPLERLPAIAYEWVYVTPILTGLVMLPASLSTASALDGSFTSKLSVVVGVLTIGRKSDLGRWRISLRS
jgi:hypothetical protein